MATISRTGIAGGSTISPTHITNIIDALDGSSSTTTVIASGSFSGSLTGHATSATTATSAATASYVLNAVSSSFATTATTATTASYVLQAVSASFATTASYVKTAQTASYVLQAVSASFAVSASYAPSTGVTINNNTNNNLVTATGTANTLNGEATLTFDGSTLAVDYAKITLKEVINNLTQSIQLANDDGYLIIGRADTSAALQVYDYGAARQVKIGAGNILDAFMTNYTFGVSGSSAFKGNTSVTGSLTVSGSNTLVGIKTITGSVFISGSKTITGTNTITGSLLISGSTTLSGNLNVSSGITGSLLGTASYATQALSASYAPGAGTPFPYTGSAAITGSLIVTGSTSFKGNVTISGSATDNITLNTNLLGGSIKARSTLVVNFADIALASAAGRFVVPLYAATSPTAGTLYWDDANAILYIWQDTAGGSWRNMPFN